MSGVTHNIDVDDLVELKLVHEIHTSVRKSFRACRRRWDWIFRQNFYPHVTAKPLEFGVAFHVAMETYYDPNTWTWPRDVIAQYAIKAFVDKAEEQRKKALEYGGEQYLEEHVQEDYDERVELGRGMLNHFFTRVAPVEDRGWYPVRVEVPFMVPIPHPDTGQTIMCKCRECTKRWAAYYRIPARSVDRTLEHKKFIRENWVGLPVVLAGRCDMLASDGEHYIVCDWKHLNVDEPILTPTGWTKMGKLQDNDLVIGSNGKSVRILGCSPVTSQTVWEIEFLDGTTIECSGTHKWSVYDAENVTRVFTTEQLAKAIVKPNAHYATPVISNPVEYDLSLTLPIHPYALGALLGDGYLSSKEVAFSSKSGDTARLLSEYLVLEDCRHFGNNKFLVKNVLIKEQLRELGLLDKLSHDKFIPELYLRASVQDRIALLQGLYDTDGLASTVRFCTVSPYLASDFAELVRSLAGKASISSSRERVHTNRKTEYFVNFWLPEWIEHARLEERKYAKRSKRGVHRKGIRSVRKMNKIADMRCIAVDANDGLYVTRDFTLTHNTAAQIRDDDEFLYLDDQIGSYVYALRKLGLPVRGFVYYEIRKGFPKPPQENKVIRLGRKFSVNQQQETSYEYYLETVFQQDKEAYEAGLYDDFLQFLKEEGIRYHRRRLLFKTDAELQEIEYNLGLEALDMIDPNVRIYPSPGRFSCTNCAFRQPCMEKNAQGDYQYALDTMYEKRQHYYVRQEASTDSKGGE